MTEFFGTDGIRGIAGHNLISVDFCIRLVDGVCNFLTNNNNIKHKRIVIAKDTRESGDFLEHAIASAFAKNGFNVDLTSVFSSPALSLVCKLGDYDLGVVISASHNPAKYNGIKFFNSNGNKLSVEQEEEIESFILKNISFDNKDLSFGRIDNIEAKAQQTYKDYIYSEFLNLNWGDFTYKIVLDTANGAAYKLAEDVFSTLFKDKEIIRIGNKPNGKNINDGCGSTSLSLLRENVLKHKNAIGIAYDGDADRVIMLDSKGNEINGDILIAIIGESLHKNNKLNKNTVILTQMSNLGVIENLKERGISTEIVDVGDRNISNKMLQEGLNFGGEQSGHIICGNFMPSGDGLVASLFILKEILLQNKSIDELKNNYQEYAQVLENIELDEEIKKKIDLTEVQNFGNEILKNKGRVVLRKSGTEPLIRILIEAQPQQNTSLIKQEIIKKIKHQIKLLTS